MAYSLMPRLLGDLTGWFDTDFPIRAGHLIPVEDTLSDKEYVLRAELPGLKPDKDLKLTVENGILTVHAEREEQEHVRGRSEFRYGLLQRAIRLPASADAEHITARYRNGILEVIVPLTTPQPSGRQITVTE
jgi:HSP20 family molecular chaperone IbpA